MIDIPHNEKVSIGKAIEFLRKKKFKNDPAFKVERFIEGVCSKATYMKLRKAPLKESEIYDCLLKKIGLVYPYDGKRQKSFLAMEKECVLAFVYRYPNEKNLLHHLINEYKRSNTIYEHLKYLALTDLSLSAVDLLNIYEIIDSPIKEILMNHVIDVLECSDPKIAAEIQHRLYFQTIHNQIDYLFLIIRNEQYYEAVALCERLIRIATFPKDQAKVRIAQLSLIHSIEPQNFNEKASELQKDPLFSWIEDDWIHICALHAYYSNERQKAKEFFMKEICCEKTFFPAILFLAHMHDPQTKFDNSVFYRFDVTNFPIEYQHLYHYFEMKFTNVSFETLENYLWTVCRKEIKEFYPKTIIAQLIHDELQWISEQTGNRARLYAFHQQFE